MNIPRPYFKNVLNFGDLYLENVIVEYDYPLLSVLSDNQGGKYLCMCFDTRGCQQWLIAPTPIIDLIKLLTNELFLDTPFKRSPKVIYAVRNYESKKEVFKAVPSRDVPLKNLPAPNEYLDAEEHEWDVYIETLQRELDPWKSTCENDVLYSTQSVKQGLFTTFIHIVPMKSKSSTFLPAKEAKKKISVRMPFGAYA